MRQVRDVNHKQVDLARKAAAGDAAARERLNRDIHAIIDFQTERFCKRFCKENRYRYRCTLDAAWDAAPGDALFCEWGNASYAWMLEDLTHSKRLARFAGKEGARIQDYLYIIANSLPFYERWKDWRFARKVHVPTYIQQLHPKAKRIFFALRAGTDMALIAQQCDMLLDQCEWLCEQIVVQLTKKNRLHLLAPPHTVSLTADNEGEKGLEHAVPFFDESPETRDHRKKLWRYWAKLSAAEQYVLEAMIIEEQDADTVLTALKSLDIRIKDGVPPDESNRQQLYYFRRKALAKLAHCMEKA